MDREISSGFWGLLQAGLDGLLQNVQAAFQLLIGDDQGRQEADDLAPTAGVFYHQAVLGALLDDGGDQLAVGLLGLLVLDELQADHGAHAADVADDLVLFLPLVVAVGDDLADGQPGGPAP